MQCKELEAVLESEGLSLLPAEAREHLAGCVNCQDLLADFSTIVVAAKQIPAEVTPPDRVWVSIRAQLEAEGIILDAQPVVMPAPAPWYSGIAEFFRPRVLAPVASAFFVVLGGMYVMEHRNSSEVARQSSPSPTPAPTQAQAKTPDTPDAAPLTTAPSQSQIAPAVEAARNSSTPQPRLSTRELKPSPSESKDVYLGDSAAVLSETEGALPNRALSNNAAVDASLRQNLRTLNSFIAECESRLKQNPQDQLTRQYLNMAYQQKAELLNAMMDSGRSEH